MYPFNVRDFGVEVYISKPSGLLFAILPKNSFFCGVLSVRARLKEMEIAVVMILIRDGNLVEADWCKPSIILANYKQQATLAQVNKRLSGQESKKASLMLITFM